MSKKNSDRSWNYRVLAFSFPELYFEVRTVYYDNGKPVSFGDPGHPINGSSIKSAKLTSRYMMKAFEKPVLWGNITGEKNLFPNKYKKLKTKKENV